MNCLQCKSETKNPKFCSQSCAATYNNKKVPKRPKKTRTCSRCKEKFTPQKGDCGYTLCKNCKGTYHNEVSWQRTLKSLQVSKGAHPSWAWAHIRALARSRYRKLQKSCEVCGYNKHIEICHIKPLTSFSLTATLEEACGPHNIKFLCPNHHWEFDNL